MPAFDQALGMIDEAVEPGQLVIELGARPGIAVGQIEAGDDYAFHRRFQVTTLGIVLHPGQAPANLQGLIVTRQDGHAIPGGLPIPEGAVAGGLQLSLGEVYGFRLQLLQADDVRLLPLQPLQQNGKPGPNAIDVVGREGEGGHGTFLERL